MKPTVKNYMRLGQPASAQLVNFGASPLDPPPLDEQGRPYGGPLNRRAEMWLKSRQWLEDAAGVQIPDSDALQVDACGPAYCYDALTRLALESKEDMRRRGALSPDESGCGRLAFAKPVAPPTAPSWFWRKIEYPKTGWR